MATVPAAAVSVAELKQAWDALAAGAFRDVGRRPAGQVTDQVQVKPRATWVPPAPALPRQGASPVWSPGAGEMVLPVLGCGGAVGASTVALALAEALAALGTTTVRLIECGSPTVTGLACASTAELGTDPVHGWVQGSRGPVLIERSALTWSGPDQVPTPTSSPALPGTAHATATGLISVVDVGWDGGSLLAEESWLATTVLSVPVLMVVTVATIPGMRRLEATLAQLAAARPAVAEVCVGVVGPRVKKWPREVRAAAGPLTRALLATQSVHEVPQDPVLALTGLSSAPLPASVRRTGEVIARRLTARRPIEEPIAEGHHS